MSERPNALVTGGSRGIGRAICLELADQGYNVAFTYRSNKDMADSLESEIEKKGGEAKGYQADAMNPESLQKVCATIQKDFPNMEVVVNNAGVAIDGLSMRFKLEDYEKLMDTNVKGAFLTTQAFIRPMMKARKGSIVFISSVIGQMGNAGQAIYGTSKAALLGLTKSLAKELGSRGIRVNAITPGFIKTDMTEGLPAEAKQSILAQIPLGSFAEAEDVAKVVAFLAGPMSKYVTGQVIGVNGGLYM